MDKRIVIGSFLLIIVILGAIYWFTLPQKSKILHTQETPVVFEVTKENIIGINADTDKIYLGLITIGNSAQRKITIVNPFVQKVKVNVTVSEDIKNITALTFKNFYLNHRENISIIITVTPTNNTPVGNYTGYLNVTFYRVD